MKSKVGGISVSYRLVLASRVFAAGLGGYVLAVLWRFAWQASSGLLRRATFLSGALSRFKDEITRRMQWTVPAMADC